MAKATSLADSLGKHLECAVCLEEYSEPKVLPCLHSFCKRCLQGLLTQAGAVFKIICPTCRSNAEIPQGQVDLLPANFFINNLISMAALHQDSQSSNLGCDNCDSEDPPGSRCTTCSLFLCDFCNEAHRRGRSTRSHSLMSLAEAKKMGSVAVTKPSFCKEHEGELMKLFCETCEEAICRDCIIVKHRDHKYTFVKDAFSKGKESLLNILSDTKAKASLIKEAVDGVLKMKRKVHSCAEQTVREVVDCFDELAACLDARRREMINTIEGFKETKLRSLEIQQEKLETALACVQSGVEFTEKAFENGSEVEILNMRKQMSSRLQDLHSAEWELKPCVNEGLKFKGDGQLRQGIATFGAVTDVVQAYATMSTVTMGNGPEGVMYNTLCGQPVEFKIIAREQSGEKRNEGGDVFMVHLNESPPLVLNVRDNENGTHTFCHTPVNEGHYKLSVYVNSHHVQGSPFHWCVEKWNLQPFYLDNIYGELQFDLTEENLIAEMYSSAYDKYDGYHDEVCYHDYKEDDPSSPPYVVGSVGFTNGKHMWKVQIHGKISQGFSLGIIDTIRNRNGELVQLGNRMWVWNSQDDEADDGEEDSDEIYVDDGEVDDDEADDCEEDSDEIYVDDGEVDDDEADDCEVDCDALDDSEVIDDDEADDDEVDDDEVDGEALGARCNISQLKSGDIVELYLDFEDGTLMLYNTRTSHLNIWDGIEGNINVSPMFRMSNGGDKVSLKM